MDSSASMSVIECREESAQGVKGKEKGEEGRRDRKDESRMTCKIEMHNIKCEKGRNRCDFLGNAGSHVFGKQFNIPGGFGMHIIYDPEIALLGTESQDILTCVQENTWSRIFLASLSLEKWKNAREFTDYFTHISIEDSHNLMLNEEASHNRIYAVRK